LGYAGEIFEAGHGRARIRDILHGVDRRVDRSPSQDRRCTAPRSEPPLRVRRSRHAAAESLAAAQRRRLAGLAPNRARARAAQYALADLPLRTFLHEQVIPYESDGGDRLIVDARPGGVRADPHLTVGGLRDGCFGCPTAKRSRTWRGVNTRDRRRRSAKISRVQD